MHNNDRMNIEGQKKSINEQNTTSPFPNREVFNEIEEDISNSLDAPDYSDLRTMSEKTYNNLASSIIDNSIKELNESASSKRKDKKYLKIVFTILLIIFMGLLLFLIYNEKQYDHRILIIYIGTLMVEIVLTFQLFIKLTFDNTYQTKVIEILHKFLENFQKID